MYIRVPDSFPITAWNLVKWNLSRRESEWTYREKVETHFTCQENMKSWQFNIKVIVSTYAFSTTFENSYDVTNQIIHLWNHKFEQYTGYLKFLASLLILIITAFRGLS